MRIPHLHPFRKENLNAFSLAIIGAAIVLILAVTGYHVQEERQREAINQQTSRTNQLILEVKNLANENKAINIQNRNYAYCNAILFAKYTRDLQPISIENLDECVLVSFPEDSAPNEATLSMGRALLLGGQTNNPQQDNSSVVLQPSTNVITPSQPVTPQGLGSPEVPVISKLDTSEERYQQIMLILRIPQCLAMPSAGIFCTPDELVVK